MAQNAIEAVPADHGQVTLRCAATPTHVEIQIEDNGCGMTADQLNSACQPFYTTKGSAGTGLGLFIAKQAVEANGGLLQIHSQEGRGTTVTLSLPRSVA